MASTSAPGPSETSSCPRATIPLSSKRRSRPYNAEPGSGKGSSVAIAGCTAIGILVALLNLGFLAYKFLGGLSNVGAYPTRKMRRVA